MSVTRESIGELAEVAAEVLVVVGEVSDPSVADARRYAVEVCSLVAAGRPPTDEMVLEAMRVADELGDLTDADLIRVGLAETSALLSAPALVALAAVAVAEDTAADPEVTDVVGDPRVGLVLSALVLSEVTTRDLLMDELLPRVRRRGAV